MSRIKLPMSWDEIKMRARDGAGRQILADLNGVDYKTFNAILREEESIHGEKLVFNSPTKDVRSSDAKEKKKKRDEEIIKAYLEGKTQAEIATMFDVTRMTICNVIKRARENGTIPDKQPKAKEPKQEPTPEPEKIQIPIKLKKMDEDLINELENLIKDHETNMEIAEAGVETLKEQIEKERLIIVQLNKLLDVAMGG